MSTRSWRRHVRRFSFSLVLAAASGFSGPSLADSFAQQTAMLAPQAVPAEHGLFGSREFAAASLSAVPQWTGMLSRLDAERGTIAACDANAAACPSVRVAYWRQMIQNLRGASPQTQLQQVNSYINQLLPYTTDAERFGRSDYWATPLESLAASGDCEDFAILKFESLLELGFTNDQMRIVVLKDMRRRIGHAVLAVSLDGRNYILDNLVPVPVTDDQLPDYMPQYSVNLTTRWAHLVPASTLVRYVR